jgi:peptidoglycan/xylan/chitin deacetylase (PgdA/CDA1 family)
MRFVSPLLKHAVYPALHRTGWLGHMTPPAGFAVVNYHGVIPSGYSVSDTFPYGNLLQPDALRQQLQFLKAHYNVIDPEDFRAWIEHRGHLPPRAVLVTCDDGLANALTDMLPVLQSEGVPCLFFVTAASCRDNPGVIWYEELYYLMRAGAVIETDLQLPALTDAESSPSESFQNQWWNTVRQASRLDARTRAEWISLLRSRRSAPQLGAERRCRLLNKGELSQLANTGVTIGAHSLSHPVLSECDEEEARREISQSKLDIEEALGRSIWAFAYPFGNRSTMGNRELRLAEEAGFACAFLNIEDWGGPANPYALPRTHVTRDTTSSELAAHLSGLYTRLQRAIGLNIAASDFTESPASLQEPAQEPAVP